MKLKHLIAKSGKKQAEIAKELNISEPLLSKFCNYICLPIPDDFNKICNLLNCKPTDVYTKDEVLLIKTEKAQKESDKFYKFSVRLPKDKKHLFEEKFLKQLGYYSLEKLMFDRVINHLEKKKANLVDTKSADKK